LKTLELPDEPETIIAIDRGEHTLATAVAISRSDPKKPMKGNGAAKRSSAAAVYTGTSKGSFRRSTVSERLSTERRKVNQQLHIIASRIIEYIEQPPKPLRHREPELNKNKLDPRTSTLVFTPSH